MDHSMYYKSTSTLKTSKSQKNIFPDYGSISILI